MSSLLKHPAIVLLISILAVLYFLSLDSSAQKAEVSLETVAVLEQEVDKMASEVSQLETQLETANHPITQEKIIRNELLMQKPGEYVLQLPDMEATEPIPPKEEKMSPWEEWQKVLF